jgi:hypothetical protein
MRRYLDYYCPGSLGLRFCPIFALKEQKPDTYGGADHRRPVSNL